MRKYTKVAVVLFESRQATELADVPGVKSAVRVAMPHGAALANLIESRFGLWCRFVLMSHKKNRAAARVVRGGCQVANLERSELREETLTALKIDENAEAPPSE